MRRGAGLAQGRAAALPARSGHTPPRRQARRRPRTDRAFRRALPTLAGAEGVRGQGQAGERAVRRGVRRNVPRSYRRARGKDEQQRAARRAAAGKGTHKGLGGFRPPRGARALGRRRAALLPHGQAGVPRYARARGPLFHKTAPRGQAGGRRAGGQAGRRALRDRVPPARKEPFRAGKRGKGTARADGGLRRNAGGLRRMPEELRRAAAGNAQRGGILRRGRVARKLGRHRVAERLHPRLADGQVHRRRIRTRLGVDDARTRTSRTRACPPRYATTR